jgi:hypothetical protein
VFQRTTLSVSNTVYSRWQMNEMKYGTEVKKPKYLEKDPVAMPSPPQVPHRLTWDRTPTTAVRGRRLTAKKIV